MPLFPLLSALAQEQTSTGGLRGFIDSAARTPLSEVVIAVCLLTAARMMIAPYLRNTAAHQRYGAYTAARFLNEVLDAIIYAGVFVFMIIRPFGIQAFLIPSGSMWPTLYVNDFIVANKAIYRYTDPKLNDVVVFRPPVQATTPDQRGPDGQVNVDFIKRCVGTPGDVVELRQGVLYRNGRAIPDPYKHFSTTLDNENFQEMPADQVSQAQQPSFKWIIWHDKLWPLNYTATDADAPQSQYSHAYAVAKEYEIPDPTDQMKAMNMPAVPLPAGQYMFMGDNRNNSFDSRGWGTVPRESIIGRSEFIWLPLSRIGQTR